MYPVFIKSGYRKFLLQCGKRVTANFSPTVVVISRYTNNDSKSDDHVDDNDFVVVDGIKLPPEPTTCCMSGCANCVWIDYAETIAKLMDGNTDKVRELVLEKIEDPNLRMFLSIELKSIQYKKDTESPKPTTADGDSNKPIN
ncbi:oxidoreductase-like domain-containing protein 1 [Stomoxys calcitrans]|nr:oxidoreductase-like domain-containing protein 1 [Stomoxys calcitrans]